MSAINHHPARVGVVIPAGGIGTRIGSHQPKQFLPLAGIPILVRSCRIFLAREDIHVVVVAAPAEYFQQSVDLLHTHLNEKEQTRLLITVGGATRQDSVRAGLETLPADIDVVLVHDAARPLADQATIDRCLQGAVKYGAVIAAVPVKDTLKLVGDRATIDRTLDRSALWQAQTPQAVRRDLLAQAFAEAARKKFIGTDEASLLEAAGIPVRVVAGSEQNLKITHPEELKMAAAILAEDANVKIGHGFDAHRLVPGRQLILGGVAIDFELGLDGHSDADVVAHALTDALLGALGAGDIGRHFPDSDSSYKGINSLLLLERIYHLVEEQHYRLANADLTIVCQRPRLAPFLDMMQSNLARCCKVDPPAINIKATTTEKMGYTGRGEGIATHAVVLLRSEHGRR
ncbi:2-C-methyl-D-erythritol 4-phosphate cytidylyltransferase [Desulfobulbus alkaliphilus]|uniref:2-C-methyl-D-erythritol 4-phosphate cytidylyltransferase n=1 Tax=Desulfobulbus alkaliphilus TaxID=869814 RepID=UPI0019660573|nr:2-C-methyl-D-erythritol 4-phosphate cytidylyltransferase [Desulfobulbus alkaliphilus]